MKPLERAIRQASMKVVDAIREARDSGYLVLVETRPGAEKLEGVEFISVEVWERVL